MEPSDNRLVFYEPVTSLKDISAFRVALDFWIYIVENEDLTGGNEEAIDDRRPNCKILPIEYTNDAGTKIIRKKYGIQYNMSRIWTRNDEDNMQRMITRTLRVPHPIMKVIESFVAIIIREIVQWLERHQESSFFYKCERAISFREREGVVSCFEVMSKERLNRLVWRQDATIDYEKTARELVRNDNLDLFHRFDLICQYYMVDELKKDRDTWWNMQRYHSPIFIGGNLSFVTRRQTLTLWNNIISDAVPRVVGWLGDAIRESSACNACNLAAIKFAFNRCPVEDRITSLYNCIAQVQANINNDYSRRHSFDFVKSTKCVLPMFNETEQLKLFTMPRFIFNLMKVFASYIDYVETTVELWLHVNHLVDGHLFISLLNEIGLLRQSESCHVHELLAKLWRCSPLTLKDHVYELPRDDDFLHTLCIRPNYLFDGESLDQPKKREDSILIEILTDAKPEFRNRLWDRFSFEIIDRSRAASLRKIMCLCLSRDDMRELERGILTSDVFRTYFAELLSNGEYSDVNEFLEIFSCGEKRQIGEFKRQLLEGCSDLTPIIRRCQLTDEGANRLNKFLSDAFQDDLDGLTKFKADMVLTCVTEAYFQAWKKINEILCFSERLCDEQALSKMKEEVLKKCVSLVESRESNIAPDNAALPVVLMWCFRKCRKSEGAS